jgi:hypothetical protein
MSIVKYPLLQAVPNFNDQITIDSNFYDVMFEELLFWTEEVSRHFVKKLRRPELESASPILAGFRIGQSPVIGLADSERCFSLRSYSRSGEIWPKSGSLPIIRISV